MNTTPFDDEAPVRVCPDCGMDRCPCRSCATIACPGCVAAANRKKGRERARLIAQHRQRTFVAEGL